MHFQITMQIRKRNFDLICHQVPDDLMQIKEGIKEKTTSMLMLMRTRSNQRSI
jgi:hypothetical protein